MPCTSGEPGSHLVYHARSVGSGAPQASVEGVEEPDEELGGVRVHVALVPAVALHRDGLKELVGRNLSFEGGGVPHLTDELAEAVHERRLDVCIVFGEEEEVSEVGDARDSLGRINRLRSLGDAAPCAEGGCLGKRERGEEGGGGCRGR